MKRLLWWDMRFQMKYGFYLLYGILTIVYLVLLAALPQSWRKDAAAILIFSDPAAMGLFFMGAIVLLEKSQRVLCAYAVSSMKVRTYAASKMISLMVISIVTALILSAAAGEAEIGGIVLGTAVSSAITTLSGLIIANRIQSLNQFILLTTPVEILVFLPALLFYYGALPKWMGYYPSCIGMQLIAGHHVSIAATVIVVLFAALLFYIAVKDTKRMWKQLGGAKL